MNPRLLARALREVPNAFKAQPLYVGLWPELIRGLYNLHEAWPEFVGPPRRLFKPPGSHYWLYEQTVGHGSIHDVVDFTHGGELWRILGVFEHIVFLCLHPQLLEDRTVHFLFNTPESTARNLRRWGRVLGKATLYEAVTYSIKYHSRHNNPLMDEGWTYPIWLGNTCIDQPQPDAIAGMRLLEEINLEGKEGHWEDGHNVHVGPGTLFQHSGPPGPHTTQTAQQLEWLARYLRMPLDVKPIEVEHLQRYDGTEATYEFDTTLGRYALDPSIRIGGTVLDYARTLGGFPNLSAGCTETPMFNFGNPPLADQLPRRHAEGLLSIHRARLAPYRDRALDAAQLLPPSHPDVAAVLALGNGTPHRDPVGYNENGDDDVVLLSRVSTICLAQLRKLAPALAMYQMFARQLAGHGIDAAAEYAELDRAIDRGLWPHADFVRLASHRQAIPLQIMAFELNCWGHPRRGVHLDEPL